MKLLKIAVAVAMMAGSIGITAPASAQWRDGRHHRAERSERHHDVRRRHYYSRHDRRYVPRHRYEKRRHYRARHAPRCWTEWRHHHRVRVCR
ncbi:hypothetical protein [Novosphingobium lindaniclasticum]|uniref:hypothetical protein n=1 Tax=Novosphingobium lindaniclasticum TaxID=1329895 RepID=UPI001267C3B5|nr:hypothetical protein [Novosphingobium lindaniclasticum]